MNDRHDRRSVQTREKIVQAAMQLFDAEGFAAVTMERIAAAADVAKGTLYYHFPEKESVVLAYMQLMRPQLHALVDELLAQPISTRERLLAFFTQAARWIGARRDLAIHYLPYRIKASVHGLNAADERSGMDIPLTRLVEAGQRTGELRGDMPGPALGRHLQLAYFAMLLAWLTTPEERPLLPLVEPILDLYLQGAASRTEANHA